MSKKTLIAISAFLIAAINTNGQSRKDSIRAEKLLRGRITTSDEFKPASGSFSTELNVNPFKGELSLNNSLNQIKFRYFSSPGFAWRLGVNVSAQDSVYEYNNPYSSSAANASSKDKLTGLTLGLNLGFEKHFKGTKRLSPYIGGEFSYTSQSYKTKETNGAVTSTLDNIWLSKYYQPYYNSNGNMVATYTYDRSLYAYNRFGLNFITGFDYYMAKNFFFGYEFNFGFSSTIFKDPELSVSGSSGTPSNSTDPEVENKTFRFGPSLMNGIRIGYVF